MIQRCKHNDRFTLIDNGVFERNKLSLKAIGLLCLMLSLPDSWDFSIRGLSAIVPDGIDGIRAAVRELEAHGYITREQAKNNGGKFCNGSFIVREKPLTNKPLTAAPITEKPTTERPQTEAPSLEKPLTVNPIQINKHNEITNKKSNETMKNGVNNTVCVPAFFNACWSAYPNKKNKSAITAEAYKQLADAGETVVMKAVKNYKAYCTANEWYHPMLASTFFNGRWREYVDGDTTEANKGSRECIYTGNGELIENVREKFKLPPGQLSMGTMHINEGGDF